MLDPEHRVFVAIPIDPLLKKEVTKQLENLRLPLRFIPEENYHITTLFIGNVSEQHLQGVIDTLESTTSQVAPFTLTTESITAKSNGHYHMLWVSFKESATYVQLANSVAKSLGFKVKRKPLPHINLVRSKSNIQGQFPIALQPYSFEVRSLELWKSTLSPKGSTYSCLRSFSLKGLRK